MRLDKFMANSGVGSRSEIKKILKTGAIEVDGVIVKDGAMKIDENNSCVKINGELVEYMKYIYIVMNKPSGVVSATEDNIHPTVVDVLDGEFVHMNPFPVGRLDIDTTGLLILTNDGEFAHQIISPKKHVKKVYQAYLEEPAQDFYIEKFSSGVLLKNGYKCLPASIRLFPEDDKFVEITIEEGKFHQVKKMVEAMENKITALHRKSIGGFVLDESELPEGHFRLMTDSEVQSLFK